MEDAGSQIALHHGDYYHYYYYYCIFQSLFKATMRPKDKNTLHYVEASLLVSSTMARCRISHHVYMHIFISPLLFTEKNKVPISATSTANEKAYLHFPADISELQTCL